MAGNVDRQKEDRGEENSIKMGRGVEKAHPRWTDRHRFLCGDQRMTIGCYAQQHWDPSAVGGTSWSVQKNLFIRSTESGLHVRQTGEEPRVSSSRPIDRPPWFAH